MLPTFIANRVEGRPGLQKVIGNTGWMFFDKVFRMGIVFALNIWVTRYLGPEKFGLLSFASAFVSLFLAIANLGLFGIVIRDVVMYPESRHKIIGTALVLKILGGVVCVCLTLTTIRFIRPHDPATFLLVSIVAAGMIFQAFDVFDFWFLSQLQSKNSLLANLPGFVLVSLGKVILILTGAPLEAFAWAAFFEIILAGIGFLFVYQKTSRELCKLRMSLEWAKSLLRDSAPLIFAGLMLMVYTRIDQVMLGQMLGDRSVGVYSAAVKIAEFWYVFPGLVLQSIFPRIIEAKKKGDVHYYDTLQKVFDSMAVISYLFVLPLCLFAKPIIVLLYGSAYADAGTVLAVYVLSGIFVMIGHAREYWITVENITRFSLYSTMLGAVVNIALNFLLIPRYGGVGAAYATLVALAVGSYGVNALSRKTLPVFRMQTKSILLIPAIVRLLKG